MPGLWQSPGSGSSEGIFVYSLDGFGKLGIVANTTMTGFPSAFCTCGVKVVCKLGGVMNAISLFSSTAVFRGNLSHLLLLHNTMGDAALEGWLRKMRRCLLCTICANRGFCLLPYPFFNLW